MILFFISFVIFLSYYILTVKFKINRLSERLMYAGLFSCAQIIATQLYLGIAGLLYPPLLAAVNLTIAVAVILYGMDGRSLHSIRSSWVSLRNTLSPESIFLLILSFFTVLWLVLAAHFLPAGRTADDMAYHLPAVYQYIQTHRISLLPIELRALFALPQNAELLFMWPTIFTENTFFINIVQIVVAALGVIAVYVLAQTLNIPSRIAFFIAILFFFTPGVLRQIGSGYIDLITHVFFLISLHAAVMFYLKQREFYLYGAAVAIGLMIGMKYNMLILALGLQPLILPTLLKKTKRAILAYFASILILAGYWYARNLIVFQNPFFPVHSSSSGLGVFNGEEPFALMPMMLEIPQKMGLLIQDIGIGALGGYGLIFWGICFPVWIFMIIKSAFDVTKGLFPLWLWAQPIFGFFILFLVPLRDLWMTSRYSLFVVAIGLLALGKAIALFQRRTLYRLFVILCCLAFSGMSFIHLAIEVNPSFAVDKPIKDVLEGKVVSKNRYFYLSSFMTNAFYGWEVLDLLTRDDPKGLNCYAAMAGYFFLTAPLYGTNVQNSIWNFQENPETQPDAFLYDYGGEKDLVYLTKKIPMSEVLRDPRYDLILSLPQTFCFIKKDFLNKPGKASLLADFYGTYVPRHIDALCNIKEVLAPNIPVVTSSQWGYALKHLQLKGRISNPIVLVPPGQENEFAQRKQWQKVYSCERPLENFKTALVFENQELKLYLNSR